MSEIGRMPPRGWVPEQTEAERLTEQRDRAERELLALKDERLRADIAHNRICNELREENTRLREEQAGATYLWLKPLIEEARAKIDTVDGLIADVRQALNERDEARDKLKTAEAERDRLREALHNVRLSAAMQVAYQSRKTQGQHEKSWRDVLRFCESAGVVGSVTRAALAEGGGQ